MLLKTANRLENTGMIQYVLFGESVSNRSQTAGFHQDPGDPCDALLSSSAGQRSASLLKTVFVLGVIRFTSLVFSPVGGGDNKCFQIGKLITA